MGPASHRCGHPAVRRGADLRARLRDPSPRHLAAPVRSRVAARPWYYSDLARPSVGEPGPDAGYSQDVVRPRWLRFDLPAKVPDVNVDDARLYRVFIAPDRVQDLLPAQDLARVAGEEGEQVELGVGQLDLSGRLVDPAL